jgi:hypothetical protein
LKQEQPVERTAVPQAKDEPLPALQAVEDLKPDSDFTPFMHPKVDAGTRRAALKKLFADPHFNVADPFEAYSEDYTKSDPIPEAMLKAINRARDMAVDGPEKVAEKERLAEQAEQAEPVERVERAQEAERTEQVEPVQQATQIEKVELPTQEPQDVPRKQDA